MLSGLDALPMFLGGLFFGVVGGFLLWKLLKLTIKLVVVLVLLALLAGAWAKWRVDRGLPPVPGVDAHATFEPSTTPSSSSSRAAGGTDGH